jgi:hypothetical protein
MAEKMVRIRLDLPEQLYHKAQAVVQYSKAQGNLHISSLSSLITSVLSDWMDKHVAFQLDAQGPAVKEVS